MPPVVLLIVLTLLAGVIAGQTSPAERAIADARRVIAAKPAQADGYNALGMALARRARETADGRYYDQAVEAVKKSLQLAPDNLEARKVETWLLLGKHEFAAALAQATALSRRAPNDATVYGFVADACAELGKYPEAEEAAQRMLDLGRSSVPGLTRAAYLREISGDIEGAADLMIKALDKLNSSLVEDRAWVLTHLGHLRVLTGDLENADSLLNEALRLFPEYHYANFQLAKVRSMQGRFADAVELLRRRYDAAPHPENLYDLAVATERAGRRSEAQKLFRDFEKAALAETQGADNANRELIFYYTDHANRPNRALEVAVRELARRRDVHTLDAAAWALHRNGKHADARREIEAALKVGIRDSRIFYHAGIISAAARDKASAVRYLSDSLSLNPRSEVAEDARKALARLR